MQVINGVSRMVYHISFAYLTKRNKRNLTSYSILLDNQSEISIFNCKHMVRNIRPTDNIIAITGIKDSEPIIVDMIADTENFGVVYFSEEATANIISFSDIEERMSINQVKNHKDITIAFSAKDRNNTDTSYLFNHRSNGLYVYEGSKMINHALAYVLSVKDKKRKYSKKEIKRAENALLMRCRMGYPNVQQFKKMIISSTVKDIDVTTKDVDIAEDIWGQYYADAAGKTGYKPTSIYEPDNLIDAAADHITNMKNQPLTLHADIFFAGGLAFLISVSKPLNYVIITHIKNRGWITILEAIEMHKNTYKKYGWNAKYLRFDREKGVSCIEAVLATKLDLHLDLSASYQHVSVAERKIRVVKERMRCEIANLGFKMNTNFLMYLPKYVARRLNINTSSIVGVNISPTEMLTGLRVSAKVELKIGFGEYANAWHPVGVSNNMEPRTTTGICLGLSNNREGSVIFYDLSKGTKQIPLVVDNFKVAPMPENVVIQLNSLARSIPIGEEDELKQQDITLAEDLMTPEVPLEDPITQENILTPVEPIAPETYINVTATAEDEKLELVVNPKFIADTILNELDVEMYDDEGIHIDEDVYATQELRGEGDNDTNMNIDEGETTNTNPTDTTDPIVITPELRGDIDTNRRLTRADHGISKKKVFHMTKILTASKVTHSRAYHISMKKGLDTYGEDAEKSIFLEVEAMEKKKVFTPVSHDNLTYKQRREAIRSFMFLKEKFKPDGSFDKLKSRLTANGKTQDRNEIKESFGRTSSPTISMSSIMTLLAIAKNEKRHLAAVDIKNAYLNANLEDQGLIIVLDNVVTKEYLKLRPDAEQFVNHKGELYCKLNRALYGTVEAAKAWYDNISTYLLDIGFNMNKIDKCVFNYTVSGVQITVGIYVDDLIISCADRDVIRMFKEALLSKYQEINFEDNKTLPYLGMILDNTNDNYIEVSMPSFVSQLVEEMKLSPTEVSKTPCGSKLFEVIEDDEKLDKDERENFHTLVAKLLYLSKHARPDILLATTFLCTRVQAPGKDDRKKLVRVMRYLNGSKTMGLRIHNSNDLDLCVYCDASFAVHPNMRSHSGAVITIGGTPVFFKSTKQKLNTKSSTESELVAISDVLPQAIYTANFLEEQLQQQVTPLLYQDNKSTIAMIENGRASAETTRHINIRYFFISDYLQQGLVNVEHLGTKEMIADYYTKPLQGEDFVKHRDHIMGLRSP